MMLEARFNLRSWASNSKQLQALPTSDDLLDKNLQSIHWVCDGILTLT